MNPIEIESTLRDAGLSKYQANAYITLLQLGTASATETAAASDVPKSRIYDVLRDLENKGYVETFEQDSLRAKALDPTEMLSSLRTQATNLERTADAIDQLWKEPNVGDHQITLVKRRETVIDGARDAIRNAETEIQLSASVAEFDELRPVLQEAHSNDVSVKLSLHPENGIDEEMPLFENAVTEARYRDLTAPFLALVDRTRTLFAYRDRGNQFGLLVNNYALTYVFHWYFQTALWEVWETIYSTHDDDLPIIYVNIRECIRDLVPLVSKGDTVEATIEGYDTQTGEWRELTGTIDDIIYSGAPIEDRSPTLSEVAGTARLLLTVDDETVTVGGWGAIKEDFEGRTIRIVRINGQSSTEDPQ